MESVVNKKYQIIYADPPYKFKTFKDDTASRWVGDKYPLMPFEDLCRLPIRDISNEQSALFLWVTMPFLPKGIELINAWGFTYKTVAFTWVKTNSNSMGLFWGMGYYTRSNAELCLLGIRGNPLERKSHSVHSVIMSPIQEHSQKPSITRERIVELFGDLSRIELFARRKVDGWDCWGNEVESDIEL